MIRLNDNSRTVIDESKVSAYYGYEEEKVYISLGGNRYVDYNSKELRDKDIELLDKLFDVKNIEKVVDQTPYEGENITWNSVTEGDVNSVIFGVDVRLRYNSFLNAIVIYKEIDKIVATIYDESLFKSLELKKVE